MAKTILEVLQENGTQLNSRSQNNPDLKKAQFNSLEDFMKALDVTVTQQPSGAMMQQQQSVKELINRNQQILTALLKSDIKIINPSNPHEEPVFLAQAIKNKKNFSLSGVQLAKYKTQMQEVTGESDVQDDYSTQILTEYSQELEVQENTLYTFLQQFENLNAFIEILATKEIQAVQEAEVAAIEDSILSNDNLSLNENEKFSATAHFSHLVNVIKNAETLTAIYQQINDPFNENNSKLYLEKRMEFIGSADALLTAEEKSLFTEEIGKLGNFPNTIFNNLANQALLEVYETLPDKSKFSGEKLATAQQAMLAGIESNLANNNCFNDGRYRYASSLGYYLEANYVDKLQNLNSLLGEDENLQLNYFQHNNELNDFFKDINDNDDLTNLLNHRDQAIAEKIKRIDQNNFAIPKLIEKMKFDNLDMLNHSFAELTELAKTAILDKYLAEKYIVESQNQENLDSKVLDEVQNRLDTALTQEGSNNKPDITYMRLLDQENAKEYLKKMLLSGKEQFKYQGNRIDKYFNIADLLPSNEEINLNTPFLRSDITFSKENFDNTLYDIVNKPVKNKNFQNLPDKIKDYYLGEITDKKDFNQLESVLESYKDVTDTNVLKNYRNQIFGMLEDGQNKLINVDSLITLYNLDKDKSAEYIVKQNIELTSIQVKDQSVFEGLSTHYDEKYNLAEIIKNDNFSTLISHPNILNKIVEITNKAKRHSNGQPLEGIEKKTQKENINSLLDAVADGIIKGDQKLIDLLSDKDNSIAEDLSNLQIKINNKQDFTTLNTDINNWSEEKLANIIKETATEVEQSNTQHKSQEYKQTQLKPAQEITINNLLKINKCIDNKEVTPKTKQERRNKFNRFIHKILSKLKILTTAEKDPDLNKGQSMVQKLGLEKNDNEVSFAQRVKAEKPKQGQHTGR